MAAIDTKREIINPKDPHGMTVLPLPGGVAQEVRNQGIKHLVLMNPEEAEALGVTLIQAASTARHLAAAKKANTPPLVQG